MSVEKRLDVDDDLLAHVDAPFHRRRAHMRQQHHLAHVRELDELGVYRRLVLEYVEAGARNLAGCDQPHQRVLVDDLAARGVDDVRLGAKELEPARRQQVKGRRRMRAVDRHDVHADEHLVETLPVGRGELLLDLGRYAATVEEELTATYWERL